MMKIKEKFNKISTELKVSLSIIAALLSIVGGVWAIDDRYVDQQEIVNTLQIYDQSIQQRISDFENDMLIKEYDNLNERYYRLKRMSRMYPDDMELLDEFNNVKTKRDALRLNLGL